MSHTVPAIRFSNYLTQVRLYAVLQLLDEWHAVVVGGAAGRWAANLRGRFTGASLVAVAASIATQIVQNTGADAYSHRAAGAMGLLATLGGGDGTALLTQVALPGIAVIMSNAHKRRALGTTNDDQTTEATMAVDSNPGKYESHGNTCAPTRQVVEVLRAYPSILDQLVLWMEEQCALATTTDQVVVEHLQSLRIFRDAHILNVNHAGDASKAETVARALHIATMARDRGGRVTQAAAELSALLPAVSNH